MTPPSRNHWIGMRKRAAKRLCGGPLRPCRTTAFRGRLVLQAGAQLRWNGRGKPDVCPYGDPERVSFVGWSMQLVPDPGGHDNYVCSRCEYDPLHDPGALKWADIPLKPPVGPEA